MGDMVTQWLEEWRGGDAAARDRLLGVMYPEMRRIAGALFRNERRNHTLQPTALVNEAWIRVGGTVAEISNDQRHLLALMARSMREILIDHARRRGAAKRDGGQRVGLTQLQLADEAVAVDLLDLDAALARLEEIDALKGRIVELRYFGGMSIEETAAATELSPATIKRHWRAARLWLFEALAGGEAPPA